MNENNSNNEKKVISNVYDKSKKNANVPNLRFPIFTENWTEISLRKCCISLEYGLNVQAVSFDGINKYIRITDIDDETNKYNNKNLVSPKGKLNDKYLVMENDILLTRTGASTGKPYIYDKKDGKLYFAGFLIRARINTTYNSKFIFYQLLTVKYKRWVQIMSTRSGQPGINSNEYGNFKFNIPKDTEQAKIATFLTLIDERIETQSKIIKDLETFKKWIINQNFNNKSNMIIGNFIEQITEKNRQCNVNNVLSVNNKLGFINQNEQFEDRIVASDDKTKYKIVRKNDFAYNPARINFGSSAKLETCDIGIVSPMYICFRCNNKNIDADYLAYYFSSNNFKNELNKKLEGSVRQCLQYDSLCKIKLYVSSLNNQQNFVKK